jgi:hypothetical protein
MDELQVLIERSDSLHSGDKDFLLSKLNSMSPIDKLKLKHSLQSGQTPAILQSLQLMRAKFIESEKPKDPDLITRVVQTVFKPTPPKAVATSFLNQTQVLGSPIPKPPTVNPNLKLNSLNSFNSLEQLRIISPFHIAFQLEQNPDLIIREFYERSEDLFDKIDDIYSRRCYFMLFISSPLFGAYINTGLTALRHPELQPSNIILNTLFQIDNKHLNSKQFKYAAMIANHLTTLCGI